MISRARWILSNDRVTFAGEGVKLIHFLSQPWAREARSVIIVKSTGQYNCVCQHGSMWSVNKPEEICACALACYMKIHKSGRYFPWLQREDCEEEELLPLSVLSQLRMDAEALPIDEQDDSSDDSAIARYVRGDYEPGGND